jgi:hypothetical protein
MNIEIGKQYVIKNHPYEPNNGLIVTVTGYLGEDVPFIDSEGHNAYYEGHRWGTAECLISYQVRTSTANDCNNINQDYLYPLDNNTGFEAGSWEALKDIFSPSDLVTS